jgi:hypothetical protein
LFTDGGLPGETDGHEDGTTELSVRDSPRRTMRSMLRT